MTRYFSVRNTVLCITFSILSQIAAIDGFTISLAPLLTARLGLGLVNNYVNNFQSSSPIQPASSPAAPVMKQSFKFQMDDVKMLSECKSECLELVYSRSMDRAFATASS